MRCGELYKENSSRPEGCRGGDQRLKRGARTLHRAPARAVTIIAVAVLHLTFRRSFSSDFPQVACTAASVSTYYPSFAQHRRLCLSRHQPAPNTPLRYKNKIQVVTPTGGIIAAPFRSISAVHFSPSSCPIPAASLGAVSMAPKRKLASTRLNLEEREYSAKGWMDLDVPPHELRPEFSLTMGQCFNWRRQGMWEVGGRSEENARASIYERAVSHVRTMFLVYMCIY